MTLSDLMGITFVSAIVVLVLHLNGLLVAQKKHELQLRCSSPMSNVAKKLPSSQWVRS